MRNKWLIICLFLLAFKYRGPDSWGKVSVAAINAVPITNSSVQLEAGGIFFENFESFSPVSFGYDIGPNGELIKLPWNDLNIIQLMKIQYILSVWEPEYNIFEVECESDSYYACYLGITLYVGLCGAAKRAVKKFRRLKGDNIQLFSLSDNLFEIKNENRELSYQTLSSCIDFYSNSGEEIISTTTSKNRYFISPQKRAQQLATITANIKKVF